MTLILVLAAASSVALAQDLGLEDDLEPIESESVRRFRELTDPEAKTDPSRKNQRPPFEFYRTQVAPFDVLTYFKPNHWTTLTQELQANLADYEGRLRTAPIPLRNMPRAVAFRREARLPEGESMRLSWPAFLPHESRTLDIELARPGAIRPDDSTQAQLLPMMPHQMLCVVLSNDPASFDIWKRYQALVPATTDLGDQQQVERSSYYRLVIPQEAGKPNLPTHPLTWTTISHVLWDGFDPSELDVGQQRALIDWLHWGGQLIISGGATSTLALLADSESFLAPYLPAEPSADSTTLTENDLQALARHYPPPVWKIERLEDPQGDWTLPGMRPPSRSATPNSRYGPIEPIDLPADRPLLLSGLAPLADDVQWITDDEGRRFGIERRVGRGRILSLAFDPKEAPLLRWKGYDTFVRRVIFRRPEDRWNPADPNALFVLPGPDLSWYRLLGRDLEPEATQPRRTVFASPEPFTPRGLGLDEPIDAALPSDPVAAWLDTAKLPSLARQGLVAASGIEVPGAPFVLRVILAYLVALVPLNWLLCRYVLRRRELAWVIVPLLAFGFAVAVERAAAIDTGYNRACDEINVLELQPGYPRAHLSRFAVLYSTGRESFSISYPGEPSALALPLNANLSIRGEQTIASTWQSSPEPSLLEFRVEPRSLAMVRAEQMLDLRSGLFLQRSAEGLETIINPTELNLRDAVLVDVGSESTGGQNRYTPIGAISAGSSVALPADRPSFSEVPQLPDDSAEERPDWINVQGFLDELCAYRWERPEDAGELRLVAWTDELMPGQNLEPSVDRHRGLTLVVAHLRYGPPPSPNGPWYTTVRPGPMLQTRTSAESDRP
ncbi:hypothetical protein [Tautonia rosea]|uniref:hypothetical protein n=1 Tax=Tautonia rosea TaxID=2728037 RepID=UPI00147653F6|nr:hypothetical protein [Tautonia rosea]